MSEPSLPNRDSTPSPIYIQKRLSRLATINHISRLITSSPSLEHLLQTAVKAIVEHLAYPDVALLLTDPKIPDMLILQASSGLYASPLIGDYRQSLSQGVIGAAAQSRQAIVVNDVQSDPRYIPIPTAQNIQAELAVPLLVDNQLQGVLNIEAATPFTEDDVADFETIADQLGAAIHRNHLFAATQTALTEAQLLYQTSQRIGMALGVEEVIDAYLAHIAVRDQYACNVTLYEFDERERRQAIIVYGRWTPEEGLIHVEERYPYVPDRFDPLLDRGETITIVDVLTDPRVPSQLREIQVQAQRPALALIPLMVRGQRIGLVILSYGQVHDWDQEDLGPYQVTAAQLATAIDSRRQHQLLNERGQQLAILQERQRLARDLHDSVTQLIFSMTLIAQSIQPAWERDPQEGEHRVQRLLELSQSALTEMRALLAELRPDQQSPMANPSPAELANKTLPGLVYVQQNGLAIALRRYAAMIAEGGPTITFDTEEYVPQSFTMEETLYRIAQEALNNIVKHAQAQHVTLILNSGPDAVHLTIADDGVGFDKAAVEPNPETAGSSPQTAPSGLGLKTMRERAGMFGGTLRFITKANQGTTLALTLPPQTMPGKDNLS